MMDIVREVMFDNAYLDTATGHVGRCNSHAIAMQGNRVMINSTLVQSNATEGDTLVLTLEGSYDGQVWLTTGLGSVTFTLAMDVAPDNLASSAAIDGVDHTFLRLRANLTQSGVPDPRAIFDASLVMSHQL